MSYLLAFAVLLVSFMLIGLTLWVMQKLASLRPTKGKSDE